jgi:hypothetical protein
VAALNIPSWPRLRLTPIGANIVGPPVSATRISACIAAYHCGALASLLGSFVA